MQTGTFSPFFLAVDFDFHFFRVPERIARTDLHDANGLSSETDTGLTAGPVMEPVVCEEDCLICNPPGLSAIIGQILEDET